MAHWPNPFRLARGARRALGGELRLFQICCLAGLVILAILAGLEAGPGAAQVAITLSVTLASQRLWTRAGQRPAWGSALVTGLLLCLLLRSDDPAIAAVAAVAAISSKFLLRPERNRALLNPALVGLATVVSLSPGASVSPGYWGPGAFLALGVALSLGTCLYRPTATAAVAPFLFWYVLLKLGAAALFDDSLVSAIGSLQSVTLLVFAFFLVADRRILPSRISGRLAFGLLVAGMAVAIGAWASQALALLTALILASTARPLFERLFVPRPRAAPEPSPVLESNAPGGFPG